MDGDRLKTKAVDFLSDAWDIIQSAIPVFDTEPVVDFNEDKHRVSGEFNIPLAYQGKPVDPHHNPGDARPGDLYRAVIEYDLGEDRSGDHLAVLRSKFELRVHVAPGIRFEYERRNTSAPAAHIHFAGVGGLLSPALMRNFDNARLKRTGEMQHLHIPVGGRRFRPSLEDFLHFLVKECGFLGVGGGDRALLTSREEWFDAQCRAAVRDAPEQAAEALRMLGYQVTPPSSGPATPYRHQGW